MDVQTSIIFCDSIQNNIVNGKLSPAISRPLSSIVPYAIPGNYSFSLYCSIENLSANTSHSFKIEVIAPDGNIIFQTSDIEIGASMNVAGSVFTPIEFAVDIRNTVVLPEGEYTAKVYVDGSLKGENKLPVFSR